MTRRGGVGLDLLAQLADIDPQILRIDRFVVPDLAQQVLVRQHLAGMDRKLLEDFVFLGRELDVLRAAPHQAAHQVDAEIAAGEGSLGALLLQAMAQGARRRAISSSAPNGLVT